MTDTLDWRALLDEATSKNSQREVAERLGYSHTTLNLIINGKYGGKTDKFAARVIEVYGVVDCPHLKTKILLSQCRTTAHGKAPTHNPTKMAHWRACQRCPHKGDEQ